MNAPFAKKMIALTAAAVSLSLGACAGMTNAGGEADVGLEPRIAALVDENRQYPRWADFPAAPADVPQPVELAARINTLKVSAGALAGEAARIGWTLTDPEIFAAAVAARGAATPISPETAATRADIDAFQQRLRDRGRAPPPVDRR